VEFLYTFDWESGAWSLVPKPCDLTGASTWVLSPYQGDANVNARIWWYGGEPILLPEPPEANVLVVEGVTTPHPEGYRVPVKPLTNVPSLTDPTSIDYQGRIRVGKYLLPTLPDNLNVAAAARRIFDAVAHQRMKSEPIAIPMLQLALKPNIPVVLQDPDGGVFVNGWIKRRHVYIEGPTHQHMTLELDTVWTGELPR
jgi:hypothetical protein